MSYSASPSFVTTISHLPENPTIESIWITDDGKVCASVEIGGLSVVFRHPKHARALAAVLTQVADGMEAKNAKTEKEKPAQ